MQIIMIAKQNSVDEDLSIVWGLDLSTKLLIKMHIRDELIAAHSAGDCIEIAVNPKMHRQEVWVDSVLDDQLDSKSNLADLLEMKASTPYSVISASYIGNIAKIEEVVEINNNTIVANLYGFPKEKKYLQIEDYKWNKYMEKNAEDSCNGLMVEYLNSCKNKYIITDFPCHEQIGNIHVAALVVI